MDTYLIDGDGQSKHRVVARQAGRPQEILPPGGGLGWISQTGLLKNPVFHVTSYTAEAGDLKSAFSTFLDVIFCSANQMPLHETCMQN